jgi:CheY-like chemotaxis protein
MVDPQTRGERRSSAPDLPGALDVLVVDDSPDYRRLIERFLHDSPHHLEEAENGAVAVQKFIAGEFNLVLMDIEMPVLDGYSATKAIRLWEREVGRPRTPIVALTACALQEHRRQSLEAGCDSHYKKPISKPDLLRLIGSYTGTEPIYVEVDGGVADLIGGYLDNCRKETRRLHEALAGCDFDLIRQIGHNLKGTGASFGFERISAIGIAVELAAEQRDSVAIGRMIAEVADFLDRVVWMPADR